MGAEQIEENFNQRQHAPQQKNLRAPGITGTANLHSQQQMDQNRQRQHARRRWNAPERDGTGARIGSLGADQHQRGAAESQAVAGQNRVGPLDFHPVYAGAGFRTGIRNLPAGFPAHQHGMVTAHGSVCDGNIAIVTLSLSDRDF